MNTDSKTAPVRLKKLTRHVSASRDRNSTQVSFKGLPRTDHVRTYWHMKFGIYKKLYCRRLRRGHAIHSVWLKILLSYSRSCVITP